MADSSLPLLDDTALTTLGRTRPWLYFLGILACVVAFFGALTMAGGAISIAAQSAPGYLLIVAGSVLLVISTPTAIVQLGYAAALSRISQASGPELRAAVEVACVRQRRVWIVNAFTVGVLAIVTLYQLLAAAQLVGFG